MKHKRLFACLMLAIILALVTVVYAATFDATKSQGSLLDWTLLDDTGGTMYVESGELDSGEGLDAALSAILHVDMAHCNTSAAGDEAACIVFIKSGTTDEDWQEFIRLEATGGTANAGDVNDTVASGQAVITLDTTTNFETPGDVFFLHDVGTMANSALVIFSGVYNNDVSITVIDNLVNAYDASDYLYDIVDQWNIRLPAETSAAKVLFYNTDADANYAVRVRYSFVTDVDDS